MPTNLEHPQTSYVHVMYALHALSGITGITSGATIVGAFVFGLPSIIAIIMNYARRGAVRGTWLESHFTWQARTFWIALVLGLLLIVLVGLLFLFGFAGLVSTHVAGGTGTLGAGAAIGGALLMLVVGAMAAGLWILYRVGRGWLALGKGRPLNV